MAVRKVKKQTRRRGIQSPHYFDYVKTQHQYLGLEELEVGQKVYAGFFFSTDTMKVLPAVVIGIRNERVRLRVPAPPGHDAPTFIKTIVPKFVTPRKLPHDVVDSEQNQSQQERLMAMRA